MATLDTITRDSLSCSNEDLAWLAGIIDGEGCIFADKYALRVQIGSADPYMAFECKKIFPFGCIKESRRLDLGENYFVYVWVVSSRRVLDLLNIVLPYLKVKKEQALAAIKLQEIRNKLKTRNYRYRNPDDQALQTSLIVKLKDLKVQDRGRKHG